jgi:hypothetical protein
VANFRGAHIVWTKTAPKMAIRGPEMQVVLAFTIRINYDLAPDIRHAPNPLWPAPTAFALMVCVASGRNTNHERIWLPKNFLINKKFNR